MTPFASIILAFLSLLAFSLSAARAEPPSHPMPSFGAAKKVARDVIYGAPEDRVTVYCGCRFKPNSSGTSGKIGTNECAYRPRKNAERGRRLEWEHIVPAEMFGGDLACWKAGDDACVDSKGARYKGRKCCAKVSDEFELMEGDLHNLTPAVGEVNGDRSNYPHSAIADPDDIDYRYGQCPFVISRTIRDAAGDNYRIADPELNRPGNPGGCLVWVTLQ